MFKSRTLKLLKGLGNRKDNPYIVGYKYDHFNEYQFINVGKKKLGVKLNRPIQVIFNCLYSKPLPISQEKKKTYLNYV